MITLAPQEMCTGCGACVFRCPHSCIRMESDTIGQLYPVVNASSCVDCHACEKVCPVLHPPILHAPQRVYAAWTNDDVQRSTSASGGIAYELYRYALSQGYKVVGASTNPDFSVTLKVASKEEDIIPFKNSKYVFSEGYDVFSQIREGLEQGEKFLLVGVSCQIAAMRKLFARYDNVVYVEILCHGMPPFDYLRQHITMLEQKLQQKAHSMSFRDPKYGTKTYTFTLYDEQGDNIYAARTKDGDSYQYGYHRSVSYRENCYHCPFAKQERVGDIILCDFYGLGKKTPFFYDKNEVSCVLIETTQGQSFFNSLLSSNVIFAEERTVEEAVNGNPRLSRPNEKTTERLKFERYIIESQGNYERAIAPLVIAYVKTLNRSPIYYRWLGLKSRLNKFLKR